MTNLINLLTAASFTDFMQQSVVGGLTMWMVIAITAVIVVICIILIAIISKSSTKKAKKKDDIVVTVGDESSKPDRPSEPVEPVKPAVVPDVVDNASAPEEVALSEASTGAEAAKEEETAEEAPAAEEKPVEETPVVEEKPVEEAPAVEEKPAEEAPVVEEKPAEKAPAVEEKPVEEAPAVEEKPVEEAPVVEEKPVEEAPVAEEKPAAAPVKRQPPVRKPAAAKAASAAAAPAKKQPPVRKPAAKADAAPATTDKNNITLLFGEAPEPSNGKYVIIKDSKNPTRPYKFQLKANNGQILYESENYKIKPKTKQVDGFRNTINNGTYTIDEEKNGTFRYKIFKVDGTLYGVGEGYKSRAAAESAIESVKKFANSANFIEDTTIDTTENK